MEKKSKQKIYYKMKNYHIKKVLMKSFQEMKKNMY